MNMGRAENRPTCSEQWLDWGRSVGSQGERSTQAAQGQCRHGGGARWRVVRKEEVSSRPQQSTRDVHLGLHVCDVLYLLVGVESGWVAYLWLTRDLYTLDSHLSSKLLRNVRHGQPLEIAINPRATNHVRRYIPSCRAVKSVRRSNGVYLEAPTASQQPTS